MDAIRAWGLTVCFGALAAGIAGIISPSGKMEKTFKFALSLFFLCCLLVPLFSIKNIQIGTTVTAGEQTVTENRNLESAVNRQAADVARQSVKELITEQCRENGVEPVSVDVSVSSKGNGTEISVKSALIVLKSADMSKQSVLKDAVDKKLGIAVNIKDGGK